MVSKVFHAFGVLGLGALLGLIFLGASVWLFTKEPIRGEIPAKFPLIVITKQPELHATAMYFEDLPEFQKSHAGSSFVIPPDMENLLRKQVEQNVRGGSNNFDESSSLPWSASFRVESGSPEKQVIEAQCTWDDDRVNTGRYEATANGFRPLAYQRFFGPGLCFKFGAPCLLLGLILAWLIVQLIRVVVPNLSMTNGTSQS